MIFFFVVNSKRLINEIILVDIYGSNQEKLSETTAHNYYIEISYRCFKNIITDTQCEHSELTFFQSIENR